ncbi:anhydro-N-acetylmuramic acid kinase [Paenibacillus amylolyticus]|nr:anhydro-N-acetylmuramic acid kinase [Paenibacillus amylolyticus]
MIRQRLPKDIRLERTADYGIPDDAREAIGFALLGHEALMGRTNTLPAVTGAEKRCNLGQSHTLVRPEFNMSSVMEGRGIRLDASGIIR